LVTSSSPGDETEGDVYWYDFAEMQAILRGVYTMLGR
jgi:hypothetical protein